MVGGIPLFSCMCCSGFLCVGKWITNPLEEACLQKHLHIFGVCVCLCVFAVKKKKLDRLQHFCSILRLYKHKSLHVFLITSKLDG